MPHPIKHYEVHVLRLLLKPEWTLKQLDRLLKTATTREVEYTGYGFFVSVNNPDIGRRRRVY
ncbi:MAG TPA: hypothetical protein VGP94_08295, partial [Tepidisphaeraceae bacterium]|nr:hypothetical protein [Tepidisphaeraceae bacterium]